MGDTVRIEYRLPVSCVRVTGSVTYTRDEVLHPNSEERTASAAVELSVIGDQRVLWVEVERGLLVDTDVSLTLTDDGRLVSSSFETTGEAGKVLLATVGVGALAAGLATGVSPLAIGAIAAATVDGARARGETVTDEAITDEPPKAPAIEDPVLKAYYDKYPDLLTLTQGYAGTTTLLHSKIASTAEQLAKTADEQERAALARALRTYEQLLPVLRRELDRLDSLFHAWRATTLKTRTEEYEFLVPLDSLRGATVAGGEVVFADTTPREVRTVWNLLDVLVTVEGHQPVEEIPRVDDDENVVLVRMPRRVQISVYRRDADARRQGVDRVICESQKPYLVMDAACEHERLHFHKSWFGKRKQGLVFSSLGALVGYTAEHTSEAAGLADTAAALPGTLTGSLEQSKKILDGVAALRDQRLDSRLATLKKQVELKQQEITQSGLLATEGSYAELERLKQEAALLEQRKTIGDVSDPNTALLADLKQQIELIKARQELAAATGGLVE